MADEVETEITAYEPKGRAANDVGPNNSAEEDSSLHIENLVEDDDGRLMPPNDSSAGLTKDLHSTDYEYIDDDVYDDSSNKEIELSESDDGGDEEDEDEVDDELVNRDDEEILAARKEREEEDEELVEEMMQNRRDEMDRESAEVLGNESIGKEMLAKMKSVFQRI